MNRSVFCSPSRGQASLEFILVLIFMLVIVGAVIVPMGQRAQFALQDVSTVGFADSGLNRLDTVFRAISSTPGAVRQLPEVFIPAGVALACDSSSRQISFIFPLNRSVFDSTGNVPPSCVETPLLSTPMSCTKSLSLPAYVDLRCQGSADPNATFLLESGQRGFTQRFRVFSRYFPSAPIRYVIDFNSV